MAGHNRFGGEGSDAEFAVGIEGHNITQLNAAGGGLVFRQEPIAAGLVQVQTAGIQGERKAADTGVGIQNDILLHAGQGGGIAQGHSIAKIIRIGDGAVRHRGGLSEGAALGDQGDLPAAMAQADARSRVLRQGQRHIVAGGGVATGGGGQGQILFPYPATGVPEFHRLVHVVDGFGAVTVQEDIGAQGLLGLEPGDVIPGAEHFFIHIPQDLAVGLQLGMVIRNRLRHRGLNRLHRGRGHTPAGLRRVNRHHGQHQAQDQQQRDGCSYEFHFLFLLFTD